MFKQGDVILIGEDAPVRVYVGTTFRMLEDMREADYGVFPIQKGRAEVLKTEVEGLQGRDIVDFKFSEIWQGALKKIGEGDIYVGQKVRISEDSVYYGNGGNNPAEVAGVITDYVVDSHPYRVRWSNGYNNVYRGFDLVPYAEKVVAKKTRKTKSPSLKAQIDASVKVLQGYDDYPTASYVIVRPRKLPEHREGNTVCHNGLRTDEPGARMVVSCIKQGIDDHPWFYKWLIDESPWSSAFYRRYAWSKKNKCVAVRTDIAANFMFGALFATRVWENPGAMQFVRTFKNKLPISFLYAISKGVDMDGKEFSIRRAAGGHWPFEHSPSKEVVKNFVLGTPKTLSPTYSELGNAPFGSVNTCFGEESRSFWLFMAFEIDKAAKKCRGRLGGVRTFFDSKKKFLEFLTKQYEEVMK